MSVVYQHVTAECDRGVVVNTACTIGYIAHDDSQSFRKPRVRNSESPLLFGLLYFWNVPFDYIGNRTGKHLQSLRHL